VLADLYSENTFTASPHQATLEDGVITQFFYNLRFTAQSYINTHYCCTAYTVTVTELQVTKTSADVAGNKHTQKPSGQH